MPTNTTPATATVISSLPYTVTQNAAGGANSSHLPVCDTGHIYSPLWFVYTPGVDETALGVQVGTSAGSATYDPTLSVWAGDVGSLAQVSEQCFNNMSPTQQQINVTPGAPVYFQITNTSSVTPTVDLVFEVIAAPALAMAAGDLFVSNDTTSFPAAVLDAADGTILRIIGFPAFECGDTDGPSGVLCIHAEDTAQTGNDDVVAVKLYDADLNLTHTTTGSVVAGQTAVSPVSGDQNGTFYLAQGVAATNSVISTISTDGVVGGTTWTLPADSIFMSAMGVTRDGTTLYYCRETVGSSAVHAYDLSGDAPLSDLVASGGGSTKRGRDIKILSDGTILTVYRNGATSADWQVRRYNSAGVLQNTYALGTSSSGLVPRIAIGPDDPTSFWAMTWPTGTGSGSTSKFQRFTVATGVVSTTIEVDQKGASASGAPMFGPSQSCPLLLIQASSPTPTPEAPPTRELAIRCLRRSPHVSDTGQRIFHRRLQLDFQPGIGNAAATNPTVMLRTSNDGGFTWSNERTGHVGQVGRYLTRVQWFQLGAARDRVYEVVWSDPATGWCLVQAFIDVEEASW